MKKFEFLVRPFLPREHKDEKLLTMLLNSYGESGWNAVSSYVDGTLVIYTFSREKYAELF